MAKKTQQDEELFEVEESEPHEVDLECDECGARLTWDPAVDALSCSYCGYSRTVERGEGTILERPLAEAGAAARGLGADVRVLRCENCGARVALGEIGTSEACVFCGSASVLAQDENRNAIRPESLIPLDVSAGEVEERFKTWVRGLWFRPNALKNTKRFDAVGVYIPAWTFDCEVASAWSADSGTYYYVTVRHAVRVNGRTQMRTRRVRKVRWRPAWGDRRDTYDDLQILASHGIKADLARELGPFDTRDLVPYRPEYLAGWRAEEYQIDLEQGWDQARDRITAMQRDRCAGDVPGDTHRRLSVRNTIADVRWKHVLLPMWTLTYRFGGKPYTVLVHGQTGKVVGKAPFSVFKILGVIVLVLALAAMVFLFV